jgi:hypothetical protein
MFNKKSAALALVALMGAVAAQAHHSFSSTFDAHKPIEITGVISKVDWVNPHSYVYMDVKGKNGKTVQWSFESLPPAMFKRAGLKREMLPIGSTVTITGFGAKDGSSSLGWVKKFKFADGREIQVTADNPSDAEFVDVK